LGIISLRFPTRKFRDFLVKLVRPWNSAPPPDIPLWQVQFLVILIYSEYKISQSDLVIFDIRNSVYLSERNTVCSNGLQIGAFNPFQTLLLSLVRQQAKPFNSKCKQVCFISTVIYFLDAYIIRRMYRILMSFSIYSTVPYDCVQQATLDNTWVFYCTEQIIC